MARIYIGVGSNSDPTRNIANGLRALMRHFGKLTLSQTYATEPVGGAGGEFYNLVVGCDSAADDVNTVVDQLRAIESACGRTRSQSDHAAIALDLDLLSFDNIRMRTDSIIIPHEDLLKRAYVLMPLAQIAPKTRHPEIGDTYENMWSKFTGKSGVLRDVTPLFEDVYRLNESLSVSGNSS